MFSLPAYAGLYGVFQLAADQPGSIDSPSTPAVFQQVYIWSLFLTFSQNDQKCSKQEEKLKVFVLSCFV